MSWTRFLASFIDLYSYAVLIYIVLSWFAGSAGGALREVYRALALLCEPFLSIFRRVLPPVMVGSAGLDLSPIVALFVLRLIGSFIARF